MRTQVLLSVLTALGASLCCITPVLAIAAASGSITSALSWIEPFRPFLISSTVLILGFAWFQILNTKKEDDCGCEKKASFFQSKKFLGLITILSLLLIAFPSYSKFFFKKDSAVLGQNQEKKTRVEFAVSGMTCASCELHIESEVKKMSGVTLVRASYDQGSTIVEFDDLKVSKDKIIAVINSTGYKVEGHPSSQLLQGKENCTASSCQIPIGDLPTETNKDLIVLKDLSQIQRAFNQYPEKTKFVAILSSTCKWCLQGAESVQQAVIENMARKNLSVIIVWTNMLQSDGENTAFRAASLFKDKNIAQFFDEANKFGDVAAKAINSSGAQAWDIYMFFDKDIQWKNTLPRPFEYAHQLGRARTWADQTKYFCGNKLTERLELITTSLQ